MTERIRQSMIVTREFARHFMPNQEPIGQKVQGWGKWFTVVGVVEDSKILRVTENTAPYFYVPIRQIYRPEMGLKFFVRTSGPVDEAVTALRREANAIDPAVPVFSAMPLEEYIARFAFRAKDRRQPAGHAGFGGFAAGCHWPLRGDGLLGGAAHQRDRHPGGAGCATARRDAHDYSRMSGAGASGIGGGIATGSCAGTSSLCLAGGSQSARSGDLRSGGGFHNFGHAVRGGQSGATGGPGRSHGGAEVRVRRNAK